jgi:hypothetical protein
MEQMRPEYGRGMLVNAFVAKAVLGLSTKTALIRVSALLQEWRNIFTALLHSTTVWILNCDHTKHIFASNGPPQIVRLITNSSNGSA